MKRALTLVEIKHLKDSRDVEDMIRTPGWKIYEAILRGHYNAKLREIEKVSNGVDEAVRSNADKGALLALRLALETPSAMVNQSNAIKAETNPADE